MTDKRKYPRTACLEYCEIELYQAGANPFPTRVINVSSNGLMIETDQPLVRGEPIKVRFQNGTDLENHFGDSRQMYIVRWCNAQDGTFSGRYAAGLQTSIVQLPARPAMAA